MALALLIATALAFPTLSYSLWGDELWSWRESIGGRLVRDATSSNLDTGTLYWEGLGWEHTAWRYLTTNHHFLFALTGRASNAIWQSFADQREWAFSESALRLVPMLFGLAGAVLWARFLLPTSRLAAVLTPFLLAVHPWYLRYLTEARGYAFLFALIPALLLFLRSAVVAGRSRAWIGVAICQILAIYAWPGILLALGGLQIAILTWLWRRRRTEGSGKDRWHWMIANLASAMILLQLTAPCIPQIWDYSDEVPFRGVGGYWILNELSWFCLGCDSLDVRDYAAVNPLYVTAQNLLQRAPFLTLTSLCLIAASLVTGTLVWLRRVPLGQPILFGIGTATFLTWALASWSGIAMYPWYFVYLLPLGAGLVALGLATLSKCVSKVAFSKSRDGERTSSRAIPWLLSAGGCIIIAVANLPQIRTIRSGSQDPRRESVAMTRPDAPLLDPVHLDVITAHCNQSAIGYDPHGWMIDKANAGPDEPPGLIQLMRLADTSSATLWVNVGGVDALERDFPDIAEQLQKNSLFELVHRVHGLAPQFERHLYRYRGGLFDFLKGL